MVNLHDNPVQWAFLMDHFQDAHEHLGKLIAEMTTDPGFDEEELRTSLGHVMSHLNRGWASRNMDRDLTHDEWESFSEYPHDLPPIA